VLPDRLLRRIAATGDSGFVTDMIRDSCCPDNGWPSGAPLVLCKTTFLQFLHGPSDRQVEKRLNLHLGGRWFVRRHRDETGS